MRFKKSVIASGIAAIAACATLAGCQGSSPQLNDLRNAGQAYPDYAVTYLNVDAFPNVTMLCIDGVGFATTSRDYNALTLVPSWDGFCKTKIGHRTT